jgi:hypothetical protein
MNHVRVSRLLQLWRKHQELDRALATLTARKTAMAAALEAAEVPLVRGAANLNGLESDSENPNSVAVEVVPGQRRSTAAKVVAAAVSLVAVVAMAIALVKRTGAPSVPAPGVATEFTALEQGLVEEYQYDHCFTSQGADTSCRAAAKLDTVSQWNAETKITYHVTLPDCQKKCVNDGGCHAITHYQTNKQCTVWTNVVGPAKTGSTGQVCYNFRQGCQR